MSSPSKQQQQQASQKLMLDTSHDYVNEYKNENDEILDRVRVMLRQEETTYICVDYFSPSLHQKREQQHRESQEQSTLSSSSLSQLSSAEKKKKNQKAKLEKSKIFRSPSALSIVEEFTKLMRGITLSPEENNNSVVSRSNSRELAEVNSKDNEEESYTSSPGRTKVSASVVDPQAWIPWRFQMCNWAYSVANTFGFCRITVAIAFDLLDRYIAQRYCPSTSGKATKTVVGPMSCRDFQQLSMTAFYLSAKVNTQHGSITLVDMVDMSRGMFTLHDFQQTEQEMLHELSWRISPPTAYHYLGEFFQLWKMKARMKKRKSSSSKRKKKKNSFPTCYCSTCQPVITGTATTSAAAIQLSYWMASSYNFLEVALTDAYFVKHMPSQLALAAMLVAGSDCGISQQDLNEFCESFEEILYIMDGYKNDDDNRDHENSNSHEENFSEIYDRLYSWPKGEISHEVQFNSPQHYDYDQQQQQYDYYCNSDEQEEYYHANSKQSNTTANNNTMERRRQECTYQ